MPEDWIGLCSVLCPRQHSIGYMGDGIYRSKDPTNMPEEVKYISKANGVYKKRLPVCV